MKKVIVACGTGIATSTVVCVKIKEALAKANVQAEIIQCKVAEIESKMAGADLIVTTTSYSNDKIPGNPCTVFPDGYWNGTGYSENC